MEIVFNQNDYTIQKFKHNSKHKYIYVIYHNKKSIESSFSLNKMINEVKKLTKEKTKCYS